MYRRIKNSNIPYTSITKETWLSLVKTLEMDQIGQIITAMYDYIYTGEEPSFNSKVMNGQWDMLIENVERMSKAYFSKADNGVASAKKRIENKKKNQTQSEPNNSIEPNDDFKVDIPIEEKHEEDNINFNTEDMGNLTNIVIVDGKAMIKEPAIETRSYSKTQIENIKQKLIDKNTPKQESVTTTIEKPELSFQDFVSEYKYQINDVINDFADGRNIRRTQGEERLKSILNSRAGRYYEKQLIALIENNVLKLTA